MFVTILPLLKGGICTKTLPFRKQLAIPVVNTAKKHELIQQKQSHTVLHIVLHSKKALDN